MQETQVQLLGWEDPLEKEMVTHSSILAWKTPWTEEPGGLQSIGLQRVKHNWVQIPTTPCSSDGKESACSAGDLVQSLGQEDPLETGKATHSSILAWRIPWTEEPGGLQSMGSQTVRHNWATNSTTTKLYLWILSFIWSFLCIIPFNFLTYCIG